MVVAMALHGIPVCLEVDRFSHPELEQSYSQTRCEHHHEPTRKILLRFFVVLAQFYLSLR